MPTATPKAGRLLVGVMSLPMLLGKTVLSEGGMAVEYAVLSNVSSRFLWRRVRRKGRSCKNNGEGRETGINFMPRAQDHTQVNMSFLVEQNTAMKSIQDD